MTAPPDINAMIKATIEAQVVQALNSMPEAIEKLVKAAMSKEVDATGKFDSYSSNKMPYLDWMVGNEIRDAARDAVRRIMKEYAPRIEAEVRKGLTSDTVVAAVTKSFIQAADQDWRINVKFEADESRR